LTSDADAMPLQQRAAAWLLQGAGLALRAIIGIGIFGGAIAAGIGSALYGFTHFGVAPVTNSAGWQSRSLDAQDSALPYSLAHFLMDGRLPPPASVKDFTRSADDAGVALDARCVVEIRGTIPQARWWTVSATDSEGLALRDSHTLTSGGAILEPGGELVLRISSTPQPGNWIRPPANRYRIALTLHDQLNTRTELTLPKVQQSGC
jgi:hypothetical protein